MSRQPVREADHWENVARRWPTRGYTNERLAAHKRQVYLDLLKRWVEIDDSQRLLKTDLFAEAFGLEPYLFDIAPPGSVIGVDISAEIVRRAKGQAAQHGIAADRFLCADVRRLPLCDNCIDLVISDSTLDHFPSEGDVVAALREICRVLRPGGTLVLTIDNKRNLTYPPYCLIRLWMRLGLTPYFIGKTLSLPKLRRTLEVGGLSVTETTTILHYPHPDWLVRWLEGFLHWLSRGRLDGFVSRSLAWLEGLERRRSRYLTGRYLALKAVKPGAV